MNLKIKNETYILFLYSEEKISFNANDKGILKFILLRILFFLDDTVFKKKKKCW